MADINARQPALLGPQIPVSTAGPTVYSKRNQMERIVAASLVAVPPNGQAILTLQAGQGMELQINRLVIQCAATNTPSGVTATTPVASDLNAQCSVQNILIRNTTSMIRGVPPGPGVPPLGTPVGLWSPFRKFTGAGQFARQGGSLRLEAGETVVITINNVSDLGGFAMAACPTVLDCDKGRPAYSGGWSATDGAAILAAQIGQAGGFAGFGPGGNISNPINSLLAWPEAGIVDLSQLVGSLTWNTTAPSNMDNEPLENPMSSFLTQLTLIDQSVCVVGLPQPGLGVQAVPLGMFWPGSGGQYRGAPWCRLQNQAGTSGNVVQLTTFGVNSTAAPPAGMDAFTSISAPFYPSIGSKPPIGCI